MVETITIKMGSSKTMDPQPHVPTNEFNNKKSLKNILHSIFHKDSKKKNKSKNNEIEKVEIAITPKVQAVQATPVEKLIENFKKTTLEKQLNKEDCVQETIEEELKNFTVKTVEVNPEDGRVLRIDSNSSEDSGFSEKFLKRSVSEESLKEVIDDLDKLKLDGDDKEDGKKKKVQTVFVPRGPIRNNLPSHLMHPYQQINQVNKQTFSGGQVIVNDQNDNISAQPTQTDESTEISRALSKVDSNVNNFAQITMEEQHLFFEIATDFVTDDILADFTEILQEPKQDFFPYIENYNNNNLPNPIEEFNTELETFNNLTEDNFSTYIFPNDNDYEPVFNNTLLTPPRSNEGFHQYSPPSATSPSFYSPPGKYSSSVTHNSPESDYGSPKSPNNFENDNENCLDLDENHLPSFIQDNFDFKDQEQLNDKLSNKTLSMKNIKDMQKELQSQFSKDYCCKRDHLSLKKFYHEHFLNLTMDERKCICIKISAMDFKMAYGVLHHILMNLSSVKCEQESIHYAMFYLLCQQVLAQKPTLFVAEFGLNLLIAATLRCYFRVELAKLVVQTIRSAMAKCDDKLPKGALFTGMDSRGDNLLGACARAGDSHADVLSVISVCKGSQRPLFDVHRTNTDGYSALHVACSSHTTEFSCLRVVHVLLAHAGADLYQGDNKAGDTALHLAVNSVSCDLRLVQTLFLHVDRKLWKQYAHATNRSSVTPLEYARSATKSSARRNYPTQVLDMLKKCR